jgi:hypothetical protein
MYEGHAFDYNVAGEQQERFFNHPERRNLAAQLALDLLICCNWDHCSRPWDGAEVYFPVSPSLDFEKRRPYISYFVRSRSSNEPRVEANYDAPIPFFTKFARLLLELEYGPLRGDFGRTNDYGYRHIKEFYQKKRDFGDVSRGPYLDAVETCLRFSLLLKWERRNALGKSQPFEMTCRRLIRERILANILKGLQPPPRAPRKRRRRSQTVSTEEDQSQDTDSDSKPNPQPGRRYHEGRPRRSPFPDPKRVRSIAGSLSTMDQERPWVNPQRTLGGSGSKVAVKWGNGCRTSSACYSQ